MKRVYEAPVVTVSDVWENMVSISIEQPPVGVHGRPERWDVTVYDGKRMIQSFQIPSTSLVESVRIDHGLEHTQEVGISVRGVGQKGAGKEATCSQRLLPSPRLRQHEVLGDALRLHWYFEDWHAPFANLVGRYEIGIANDEHTDTETVQEFVCEYSPEGGECLQGNAYIRLAPHMMREASSFALFGRVRCYSSIHHVWGQWSPRVRLLCLSPLHVELSSVTSQSLVFSWGRNASEAGNLHVTVQEADVAVDRMEIIAWPATSRRGQPRLRTEGPPVAACVPPRSVSTGQSRVFGPNITMLDGLEPYTVYNVCCRWKQLCGGDWHTAYFRVGTKPEPEIVAIPSIGHSFVELQWAPKGHADHSAVALRELDDYVDDNFEVGGDHAPSYRLVRDSVVANKGADLHRITVSNGIEPVKVIDVPHSADQRVQRHRLEDLPSGTTLRVMVRTASHYVVDGGDHWSWGTQSGVKVMTTVSALRVVPQERGPNFIVLQLQCDPPDAVRSLLPNAMFAEVDSSLRPQYVTPKSGVYTVEPLGEGEVSVESFLDDGDKRWGVRRGSITAVPTTMVRLDAVAKVQLQELRANWTYRFSINVRDTEGRWWGRRSTVFTTSAEDILYVRPYVEAGLERSLRIDQAYHDAMFSAKSSVSIRYPVVIGDQRREELSVSTAMLPSRLMSVALRTHVSALGSDHCIINWEAFAIADGATGAASVLHHSDMAVHHAKVFNTSPNALYEYRMKVFVSMRESTRLELQQSRGVTDTARELYFRSAVRTAKVLGLEEGFRYRIALSYFNVVAQKWSPWSEPVSVRPADRLVTLATRVAGNGVSFRWKRLVVPPIDLEHNPTHTIAPTHYDVRICRDALVPARSAQAEIVVQVKQPEFELKDLPCGILSVSARSWYDADSCGPYAAPCYIAITPLQVMATSITQSTAFLTWELPDGIVPTRGGRGRIIINLTSADGARRTTLDVGQFDTTYTLKHLAPSTLYTVSALQLLEVQGDSVPHDFGSIDPSTFSTLGPLSVSVAELGEDFVVLSWPRRMADAVNMVGVGLPTDSLPLDGEAILCTPTTVGVSSPIRLLSRPGTAPTVAEAAMGTAPSTPARGAFSLMTAETPRTPHRHAFSKVRAASIGERYELVVEDYEYGHEMRFIIPPCPRAGAGACVQHRVAGLIAGGSYRARVRIDSEAAFYSDDVLFRTPDPLVVQYTPQEVKEGGGAGFAGQGLLAFVHPLYAVGGADTLQAAAGCEWVPVRTTTEVKVEEQPRAPTRHLTGSRAAIALFKSRKPYLRKFVLPPASHTLVLTGLPPPGTVLVVSARQLSSSGDGVWLPWVHTEVRV